MAGYRCFPLCVHTGVMQYGVQAALSSPGPPFKMNPINKNGGHGVAGNDPFMKIKEVGMKTMMKWTAVICGFGLLLVGQSAIADDMSPPEDYSQQQMDQQQMEGYSQQQQMDQQQTEGYTQQQQRDQQRQQGQQVGQQEGRWMDESMRVSDLRRDDVMGQSIRDRSGNEVGTVRDAVTDENQKILYIIAAREQDEEMVPIPLDLIRTEGSADTRWLVVDLESEEIHRAPSITGENLRDFNQQEVRGYYDNLRQQQ